MGGQGVLTSPCASYTKLAIFSVIKTCHLLAFLDLCCHQAKLLHLSEIVKYTTPIADHTFILQFFSHIFLLELTFYTH